ncbi:MAG TPA: SH3 domain-containing protein [Aggregatilineaceae bacterium]|nr:SH3 domain-containing protein [Aggregatilineaceae bacterium]
MWKRLILPVSLIVVLLAPLVISRAQDSTPTVLINLALADLSRRAGGETITLDDMTRWDWEQVNYPDASLGCPQEGQSYAQVATQGYRLTFTIRGANFDYRATTNGSTFFLCSGPASIPAAPTVAATNTPAADGTDGVEDNTTVATPVGRQVCTDAMNSRLNTGMSGQVRTTGLAVNVRSAAGTGNSTIGRLTPGQAFRVVGGPECANSIVWWEITSDTFNGWIGEGQYGVYWVEPTSAATTTSTTTTTTNNTPVGGAATNTPVGGTTSTTPTTPLAAGQPGAAVVYELSPLPITLDNAANLGRYIELPISEPITDIGWSVDNSTLAASANSGGWIYAMAALGTPPRLLQVPNGPAYGVAFAPSGGFMATGHNDNTVRVWDIVTGGQRAILRGHSAPVLAVAFSPDGTHVASGGQDNTIILWDVNTRTATVTLEGHTGAITALAFSPDGLLLASASEDNSVRLWDTVSGTAASTLSGHTAPVHAVVFSADGTHLASAGDDMTVRLWDISTGEAALFEGHTAPVLALALNADGTILASGGGSTTATNDNAVRLWNVQTGEVIATLSDYGGTPDTIVTGLLFNRDSSLLAFSTVQGQNSTIRLWGGQ